MFLAGISFTLLDIIIYVFLLIFLIIGLFKGLVKIVFSFMKGIVSLVVTYFLTEPASKLLCSTGLDESLNESIHKVLIEKAPSLNNALDAVNYKNQIFAATEEAGMPEFLGKIISSLVNIENTNYATVGDALSSSITTLLITIISFVMVFVLLTILVAVLSKLLSYLVTFSGLKTIDRVLGMVLNGIYGIIIISLIFLVTSVIVSAIPAATEFVNTLVYPEGYDTTSFSIAKWLYENNPLNFILKGLVGADN